MTALALLLVALHTPPREPVRAELCLAHVNLMIADAMRETGRVAGPSSFVRDWWEARLPEPGRRGVLTPEQRAALQQRLAERKVRDPERHNAERGSCVDEAIDAGAVPGMGPA